MNKTILAAALSLAAFLPAPAAAQSFNLSDLLGKVAGSLGDSKGKEGGVVSDLLDGVFTKEKLTVEDIAGEWQSSGAAVDFRSENFLKKAGGTAAASALEAKINPYFKKYGFDKSVITIGKDGTIAITFGKSVLRGTITPNGDKRYAGNFIVKFKALGVMSLGEYDTYVALVDNPLNGTKQLKIMFDAQKMVAMMRCVAAISKSSIARSVVSAIESYEGVCVGFRCQPYSGTERKK